jgi:hypothetical protein
MPRFLLRGFFVLTLALTATTPAAAQGKFGGTAPEFPPGTFSDGRQHRLGDFAGKVVVLYFFEPQ